MSRQHRGMLPPAAGLAVLLLAFVAARGETVETDVLSVEVPSGVEVAAGGTARFDLAIAIKPEFHIMANRGPREYIPTVLTIKPPAAGLALKVDYPQGKPYTLIEGMDPIPVYNGKVSLRGRLGAPATMATGPTTVTLNLQYQACSEQTCFAPVQLAIRLPVTVTAASAPEETPPEDSAETSPQSPDAPIIRETGQDAPALDKALDEGLLWLLPLVFIGGLALNLTPCVFPVIPVTMGFFVSQGEHRLGRTLPLALLYVLGMAVVFTVLGSAAALAGSQIGLALQSPLGVGIICIILIALAASLFGAFEIHVPTGLLGRLQGKTGLLGALAMGAVVGLVAAPCVGPFVAALITFVGQMGSRLAARGVGPLGRAAAGGGLFFVLSLGFGLPYLVLGIFSGMINRVPRGGGWLLWVRRLLAFPVLGLVIYFLLPYLCEAAYWTLLAALSLAAAVYLGVVEGWTRRPWSSRFVVARLAAAIVLTALAVGVFTLRAMPALGWVQSGRGSSIPWAEFQEGQLVDARAAGQPAVAYFTASWCVNCRAMERGVFRSNAARQASAGVRLVKIDISKTPTGDGEKAALYRKFVRGGPPVLVFFDRRGKATVHRGLIEADEFARLLQEIKK
ncbi:MAG: thioredoxin fold domain-containing protein [Anaerolineaceae bacterium]|nr:thioredoxin fold domain-containing protein [Anaerolineaceae bacterium]